MGAGLSSRSLAFRFLITKEEPCTRPPRKLANIDKLSRTRSITGFHSSGRLVGRTSGLDIKPTLMKRRSNGAVGNNRIRAPRGMETRPSARETPHSRPPMRVTWNAAPPMNTIRI
jgi:hypothetical protein